MAERTGLMIAAERGHADEVRALLAHGAAVDAVGPSDQTALMYGVRHPEVVRALLAAGADVHHRDANGLTAVWKVAGYYSPGLADSLRLLAAAGADVNAPNAYGAHVLTEVVQPLRADVFEALLALGADPNHRSRTGQTALHLAAEDGHEGFVRALIAAGADLLALAKRPGKPRRTAAEQARVVGNVTIVKLLAAAGADPRAAKAADALLDPKIAIAEECLARVSCTPLPEPERQQLAAGSALERLLAEAIASGDATAFLAGLSTALDSRLAPSFVDYVQTTLDVGGIAGAWRLDGIGRAIRSLGTYAEVLGVTCLPEGAVFPALRVGRDRAGRELWVLAAAVTSSERDGTVLCGTSDELRWIGAEIVRDAGFATAVGDFRQNFVECLENRSSRLDVIDLLFLQGAIDSEDRELAVQAAYGFDEKREALGRDHARFLTSTEAVPHVPDTLAALVDALDAWPHEARVGVALAAVEALHRSLGATELQRNVVAACAKWLASPDAPRKTELRSATDRCDEVWNAQCGDSGEKAPLLSATTYLGWAALNPHELSDAAIAVRQAGEAIGEGPVLAAIRARTA